MLHPQHFAHACCPVTIRHFIEANDIQLVWLEHLANLFRGRARVFEGEAGLLKELDENPDGFNNNDMIIVRYSGPIGAPGMPEMLDPTSRITALCRERNIVVALMTDARFSGGSVGLVIGHVGPEAAVGGPIALVEDGDQ